MCSVIVWLKFDCCVFYIAQRQPEEKKKHIKLPRIRKQQQNHTEKKTVLLLESNAIDALSIISISFVNTVNSLFHFKC